MKQDISYAWLHVLEDFNNTGKNRPDLQQRFSQSRRWQEENNTHIVDTPGVVQLAMDGVWLVWDQLGQVHVVLNIPQLPGTTEK